MMEKGKRPSADTPPANKNGFSLISDEKLRELYTNLLRCRMVERHAAGLRNGSKHVRELGFAAAFEAARVGVAADLLPDDSVISLKDDFLIGLLTGAPLAEVFNPQSGAGLNGEDASRARMHSLLGVSLINKQAKNRRVGVVFSNEGRSSLWQDSLHAAEAHGLPLIFVQPEDPEPGSKLTPKAKAADERSVGYLPHIGVDGNDLVAVYRVAHEAIDRARRGRGPTLIECMTFKLGKRHRATNSVANMENYLENKGLMSFTLKREITTSIAAELTALVNSR
jgi:TPP-dependent pyruvate/acetoin dehydrogenase alpha subunit